MKCLKSVVRFLFIVAVIIACSPLILIFGSMALLWICFCWAFDYDKLFYYGLVTK